LKELDVSKNLKLNRLICYGNNLTELDVSSNTGLTDLLCVENSVSKYLIAKDGAWTVDMSKIVSPDNFDRIISISDGDFDPETGIVTFVNSIPNFTYSYDVGKDGQVMTVTVNLTKHAHAFSDWQVRESATCTKGGTEYRVCECGEEETRTIGPNGHTFGRWIVEKPASSEEDGLEYRICSVCQYKETHIIPADEYRAGDTDSDGVITSDDATYLLYHVFYPADYPLRQDCDFNKDGSVTSDDATYLLYHVFYPDDYPLVSKLS
jgi:hypothetical protein